MTSKQKWQLFCIILWSISASCNLSGIGFDSENKVSHFLCLILDISAIAFFVFTFPISDENDGDDTDDDEDDDDSNLDVDLITKVGKSQNLAPQG